MFGRPLQRYDTVERNKEFLSSVIFSLKNHSAIITNTREGIPSRHFHHSRSLDTHYNNNKNKNKNTHLHLRRILQLTRGNTFNAKYEKGTSPEYCTFLLRTISKFDREDIECIPGNIQEYNINHSNNNRKRVDSSRNTAHNIII